MKKKHGKKSTVNKAFYFMVVPFMILFFIFQKYMLTGYSKAAMK